VIEFSKSAKRIILSHSRVFEDEERGKTSKDKQVQKDGTKKTARKPKSGIEKTTLGDISNLAALKSEMEEKENKATEKKKK